MSENSSPQQGLVGSPTVLIVDDEELMREVVTIMIEDNGGKPIIAKDGEEAVRVFSENKAAIDYILMDFSMPKKNGYEAYLEIKKLKPEIGVVFVSGLRLTTEVDALHKKGEVGFLSKPFHEADVIKALNKIKK